MYKYKNYAYKMYTCNYIYVIYVVLMDFHVFLFKTEIWDQVVSHSKVNGSKGPSRIATTHGSLHQVWQQGGLII